MQDRRYEVDALERERYCAHDPKTDLELADERHRIKTWQQIRRVTNHLPPDPDKHFMSLHLDDEQVATILAAVALTGKDAEKGLTQICKEWRERPLAI